MSEGVDMTEAPVHDEPAVNITEHEIVMLNPEVCTDLNHQVLLPLPSKQFCNLNLSRKSNGQA